MEAKHKGACSELIASVWLMQQGFEVFRNVSPHGSTDVVAIKYDCTYRIDVKTANVSIMQDGTVRNYCSFKPPKGVRCLVVLSNGNCMWGDLMGNSCDTPY